MEQYSELSIFGLAHDLPRPEKSLGPYICDKNLVLSKGEHNLLSLDPKFNLTFEPTNYAFQVELERMVAKHRMSQYKNTRATKLSEQLGVGSNRIETELVTESVEKNIRLDRLNNIFHETKNSYIYNPIDKTVCFNKRKATDYKLNRSINLPRPMNGDDEYQCEIKKREYWKMFEKYKNIRGITPKKNGKESSKVDPINISPDEKTAMREIKGRIKSGEVCITSTDKSSRFALLSRQQYLEAGAVHTNKDQKIGWDRVKYLNGQVKAHMWWLSRAVGYSKDKDQDRIN